MDPAHRAAILEKGFTVLKMFAKGGNSEVYLARHEVGDIVEWNAIFLFPYSHTQATGDIKAIKLFVPRKGTKSSSSVPVTSQHITHVKHAKTEWCLMQKVRHPFIVKAMEMFQCKGHWHIVFPFLSGGDMFFHLSRCGKFCEELVRNYSAQLVLALGYLHSEAIVYNDLKPENIMLDQDGFVKLGKCHIIIRYQQDMVIAFV